MGWIKRATKRVKKAVKRIGGKTVMKPIKGLKGLIKPDDGPDEPEETGMRSEAATRLVKTTKQAGAGQINYDEEVTA